MIYRLCRFRLIRWDRLITSCLLCVQPSWIALKPLFLPFLPCPTRGPVLLDRFENVELDTRTSGRYNAYVCIRAFWTGTNGVAVCENEWSRRWTGCCKFRGTVWLLVMVFMKVLNGVQGEKGTVESKWLMVWMRGLILFPFCARFLESRNYASGVSWDCGIVGKR